MYCRRCGNELSNDALFCNQCGLKVESLNEETVNEEEIKKNIKNDSLISEEVMKTTDDIFEDKNLEGTKEEEENLFVINAEMEMREEENEMKTSKPSAEGYLKNTQCTLDDAKYAFDLKSFNKYRKLIIKSISVLGNVISIIAIIGFIATIVEEYNNDSLYKLIIYVVRFFIMVGEVGIIVFIPGIIQELLELEKTDIREGVGLKQVLINKLIHLVVQFGLFNNLRSVNNVQALQILGIAMNDGFGDQLYGLTQVFDKALIFLIIAMIVYWYYEKHVVYPKEEE